jgi:hypothetical protein
MGATEEGQEPRHERPQEGGTFSASSAEAVQSATEAPCQVVNL